MLVYEYVNNGNLKQWLHGAMRHNEYLTWETTVKVLLGTVKAQVHSAKLNLFWNKTSLDVSDIGLAKLLGAGKRYITTQVNLWVNFFLLLLLIPFQLEYVAPEYANTGLLNEKSDIYSFGGRVVRIDHRKRSCAQEVNYFLQNTAKFCSSGFENVDLHLIS
ncbi:probable receptor-like protein kinase At5g18500 [Solanum stenotomum]|uniref:probable receptor-like protein kinase At5g18500 n=1 Tax=Solanum stenotomum TaxID=172797 RepID=UPI0020D12041|nr:probable receptor-like protein kinase At5g18500 [Solanum stenotomum]